MMGTAHVECQGWLGNWKGDSQSGGLAYSREFERRKTRVTQKLKGVKTHKGG